MTVYLVGAGPGDPGLLTVRGAELLAAADVVVHDRLVDPRVLAAVPGTARLIDVGKRAGDSAVSQEEVNDLLVELGGGPGVVVRLKGGDPYVLGRGGEEAAALEAGGVDYEVVPGVTAALAVPALAGVPLTMRGVSSGFTVLTAHDAGAPSVGVDWELAARLPWSLVLLMAASSSAEVAGRLLGAGRDPATPVLVVESGTLPAQRARRTSLSDLATMQIRSPATIVVGEVARLGLWSREELPLSGWRVVVTRPAGQEGGLADLLSAAGAMPLLLPTVEVVAPPDGGAALREAAGRLGTFDWLVLTSANGVERLFRELRDARAVGSAKVAAIGPATAETLRRHGVVADLVPERFVGEALVGAFAALGPAARGNGRVLLARAAEARDVVPTGLAALGYEVEVVEAYATRTAELVAGAWDGARDADAVTFTSPSTLAGYLELAGGQPVPGVVVTIGPVTTAAARRSGIRVDAEASEHTAAGLVAALAGIAAARRRP